MSLSDQPTYYDVLDIKVDASPHEIREAYLRVKATYNKDSAALYTMISTEEREEMIKMIEEAHHILSHPAKRKEYDRYHGLLDPNDDFSPPPSTHKKIVSIDRVPPMDLAPEGDDLLVAPATDFGSPPPFGSPVREASNSPFDQPPEQMVHATQSHSAPQAMISPFLESPVPLPQHNPQPETQNNKPSQKQVIDEFEASLAKEIEAETEWSGLFLRRVRESRKFSIEELSSITKISKAYLHAIEEENFKKLPAAVFVRGFITQIARTLKLPAPMVSSAYLAKFNQALSEKAANSK